MMQENESRRAPFRLGPWMVRPDRNLLCAGERELTLEPRVMLVLVLLAARPGEVVTREELKAEVWQDTGMGEDSLNRAISDLRHALDPDATRYIETIRKVGYRLVAPVTPLVPERGRESARRWRQLAGTAVVAAVVAVLVLVTSTNGPEPIRPVPSIPLTSEPGLECRPSLSPDGKRVAYVKKDPELPEADIYVSTRGAGSPVQLTDHPGYESYPTWSPDGTELAFTRLWGDSAGIFTVPAGGGESRCIYESDLFPRHLDWSADGRWLVFSEGPVDEERSRLLVLDMSDDHRRVRALTEPPAGGASDTYPRFSPAGDDVAFIRTGRSGLSDIYSVGFDGGPLERLTHGQIKIWGLDWSSQGDEVFFSSFAGGPYTLSVVSISSGSVRRTSILSQWVRYPSIATGSSCLAFESREENQNIMVMPLLGTEADTIAPRPLIASNVQDCEPAWSPDGAAIAFVSMRSGHRELWLCDRDGGQPRRLTDFEGAYVASPIWSPEGERLAFLAAADHMAMYVTSVRGAEPQRVTPVGHNALPCSWSRDGRRLYYSCDAGEGWQIWTVSPEGGDAARVTKEGAIAAIESPDGVTLYLVRPDRNGIWSRPVDGGEMHCVVPGFRASDFQGWTVTATGIVSVRTAGSWATLVLHDPRGREIGEIAEIPRYPSTRFSVSPDGQSVLFVRSEQLDIDLRMLDHIP